VVEGRVTLCKNDACPAQGYKRVMNWVKKLDIKDLGDSLLTALMADGLDTKALVFDIPDLYRLTPGDLELLNVGNGRLGQSLAVKVCNEIARTKTLTVDMFMGSLGIKFLGRSMARKIGLDSPNDYLDISVEDLAGKDGMGPNKARDMNASIIANEKLINKLLSIITVTPLKAKQKVPSQSMNTTCIAELNRKTVCFTGVRLKDPRHIARFENSGAEEKSGVSAGLDILVAKDLSKMSAKMVKAKASGTQIMSFDEFVKILDAN
jgi:NAD-dependent DNA ligase